MYLLVFLTLCISLIGIYTQVLGLQTARMFSHQTSIAQAMLQWHAAAVGQAQFAVDFAPAGASANYLGQSGCSLTTGAINTTNCRVAGGAATATVQPMATTPPLPMLRCAEKTPPNTLPCWYSLPPNYNTAPYTFFSIAYQAGTSVQSYVITYVPPPTIATDLISLPGPIAGAPQIGMTMSDLLQQLRHTNTPLLAYGVVDGNGRVVTGGMSGSGNTVAIQYPVPMGAWGTVPQGSVAIISSPTTPPCPTNSSPVGGVCYCRAVGPNPAYPVTASGGVCL